MISAKDIESCYERIKPYISVTRLEKSLYLSRGRTQAYLKMESEQALVKSFKIRGVLGKLTLLDEEHLQRGVGTISSGNQGVALAYAAHLLGMEEPHIIAPVNSPGPKLEKIRYYGAQIKLLGDSFDQANLQGERVFQNTGWTKIDAREDPEGLCGQGTIAMEILQSLPDVDILLIPMGSGGNAIANGSYLRQRKPTVKIYAVEAENSPALLENYEKGRWTKSFDFPRDALMQSLVGGCAKHTYDHGKECIDQVLLVSDEEVEKAVYDLAQKEKIIAEPDSAAVYAAYQRYSHEFEGKKTAMVITGGNIDNELFVSIIQKLGLY